MDQRLRGILNGHLKWLNTTLEWRNEGWRNDGFHKWDSRDIQKWQRMLGDIAACILRDTFTPVEDLGLSTTARNALKRYGLISAEAVRDAVDAHAPIRGLGATRLAEINRRLVEMGLLD